MATFFEDLAFIDRRISVATARREAAVDASYLGENAQEREDGASGYRFWEAQRAASLFAREKLLRDAGHAALEFMEIPEPELAEEELVA